MLVAFAEGGYRFLASPGRPFSGGALADPGLDLVHAVLHRPRPLAAGLAAAAEHVTAAGRPVAAITGFELRIPTPLTAAGFDEFNAGYVERLKRMGLVAGELMPAARTTVAATAGAVAEPSLFGFTYTAPGDRPGPAFILSGAPEERPASGAEMLDSMMDTLSARLEEMGAGWADATSLQLYGMDEVQALLPERVLARAGGGAGLGVHWFPSRPPIDTLRMEIDARAAGRELVLS